MNERIVAIVRRCTEFEHIKKTLNGPISNVFFVCLSIETYLYCIQHELDVIIPVELPDVAGHNFNEKGLLLAREWIEAASGPEAMLSADEKIHLSVSFIYFFATALFARCLIEAIVKKWHPDRVFLWSDKERPVISNRAPSMGEGAIFAQVASMFLKEHKISYQVISHQQSSDTAGISASKPRWLLDRLGIIGLYLRNVRHAGMKYRQYLQLKGNCIKLRFRIGLLKAKQKFCQRPMILFWGSHVDAVYQAELAQHWATEYGWIVVRLERIDYETLKRRSKIRDSDLPQGQDQSLALHALGNLKHAGASVNEGELLMRVKRWSRKNRHELPEVLCNQLLEYQYLAMARYVSTFKNEISRATSVIQKINPGCVVTHLNTPVAIAAKQAHVPSVVVAHGGIQSPYFISMHGNVNVVSGKLMKQLFEETNQFTGKMLDIGWPHIRLPLKKGSKNESYASRMKHVTVFVTQIDFYCWTPVDFKFFCTLCRRLSAKAHQDTFVLIIKIHPRTTEHEKGIYKILFEADGNRVRIESTPQIDTVLEHTDLLLCTGPTTAILDSFSHGIPSMFLFNHFGVHPASNCLYRTLLDELPSASDENQFEKLFELMLNSESYRAEVRKNQNVVAAKILRSYGTEASNAISDVCRELMVADNK